MVHHVTGAKNKSPKQLHKITVEKKANGFEVKKHHRPTDGSYMSDSEQEPGMVFDKAAPAHKHIKAAMAEMHPDGDEGSPGQLGGGPPVEQL